MAAKKAALVKSRKSNKRKWRKPEDEIMEPNRGTETDAPLEAHSAQAAVANNVAPPPARPKRGLAIWILCVVAALVAIGIYSGIHSRVAADSALANVAAETSVRSVRVAYPQSGERRQTIDLPGNVQAFYDTPIYARTSGYVKHWYLDIGARVHTGQLMADIETPELDQQLQQAQADLKTAQANLNIAGITSTRWQKLLAKNAVSKQEADQAMSDLSARQSAVSASEANVRRLQQMQNFEKVVAPFDGVVTARNVDIGSLIEAGANSQSRELFHVGALNQLRVYVAVPEAYANAVSDGATVNLTETDRPGEVFQGKLVRNSSAIDPISRTLNAEVDVKNANGHLLPGAYVFVHLQLPGNPRSVTLPSNALLFRAEGLRVGVVKQNRVVLTPVFIGHDYGDSVEVTSGLSPQDAVILDPPDSLAADETVKVIEPGKQGPA
jgi:RND family efflux transporter MFP subunit